MDLGIKGKRAIVQGASSGLGYAIAEQLVREGARVAICSRDEGRIREAAKKMGAELAVACDLNQAGEPQRLAREVERAMGGVDILIVNTGGPPKGPVADITRAQWQSGFESLWLSCVESMQSVIPGMRERKWGRIILITSAAAREPMPGLNISNGLRAGLLGLVKSASNELAQFGITINALLPGYTDTERLRELQIPPEKITAQIPAGRLGKPEELGATAAFLASQQAAYISGQAVAIDGGYLHSI